MFLGNSYAFAACAVLGSVKKKKAPNIDQSVLTRSRRVKLLIKITIPYTHAQVYKFCPTQSKIIVSTEGHVCLESY